MKYIVFFWVTAFAFAAARAEEEQPIVLDPLEILAQGERVHVSDRTLRDLEYALGVRNLSVQRAEMHGLMMDRYRTDGFRDSASLFDELREGLSLGKDAEKIYGGRVDIGPAKLYLRKVRIPALRLSDALRLSFKWRRGPSAILQIRF